MYLTDFIVFGYHYERHLKKLNLSVVNILVNCPVI